MSSRPASAVIVRLSKQQQKTNKQSNKQTKKPYPVCQLENGFEKNRRARKDLTCKPGEDRAEEDRSGRLRKELKWLGWTYYRERRRNQADSQKSAVYRRKRGWFPGQLLGMGLQRHSVVLCLFGFHPDNPCLRKMLMGWCALVIPALER